MRNRMKFGMSHTAVLICLLWGLAPLSVNAQEEAAAPLAGKTVAILAATDFEDIEVLYPMFRLREEGVKVVIVGGWRAGQVTGKHGWELKVDALASQVAAEDIDAVIIPGGWAPDSLRTSEPVLKLVRDAFDSGKVVAAICHGPSVLVSADVLQGKKATSFRSVKDDVVNAGATFLDQPVVVDGNLITSRHPGDLPHFSKAIIKALSQ